jgi:2-oxoglutarate-Fe(II)-dependent dioxygenase family protein
VHLSRFRVSTRMPAEHIRSLDGKNVSSADWDILLDGPTFVRMPDNRPLCVVLPGVMSKFTEDAEIYDILDRMGKAGSTSNRGKASATLRVQPGTQKRSYSKPVLSNIVGAFDPGGIYHYCRWSTYTAEHMDEWSALFPALQEVASHLREHVPDRYEAQMREAARTQQEWIAPGTPFSTLTVNHTYSTGTHVDKGDLDAGFSTIFVARRGSLTGGQLCFPEYRVAVDLKDGDLILMDAHQWHSNARIYCRCGEHQTYGPCKTCGASRISVVAYYRTKLAQCGSYEDELAKARAKNGE